MPADQPQPDPATSSAAAAPPPADPAPPPPDQGIDLGTRSSLRIGRATDNDLTLDDLRISRHHVLITRMASGDLEVRDLDSANGTFVNGRRVRSQRIDDGDFIGVGGQTLQLRGGRLRSVSARHTAWFGAVDLVVSIGQRRILDEVGFAVEPSSLLAVIGPSGSGKSTLLNALTGFGPADSGNVVFDGRDVYAAYDDLRLRMGLVPQADILHTQLTVQQALGFEAELRFPRDVTPAARAERVTAVMVELHLDHRAGTRIDRLSGGERKRVSVGCELLTEPSLLFLDEPTSGLDPGNEAALMATLRDLARAGRTVVVVTHSVQSLELCDKLLVLAPGGKLAYFGPPQDALAYFAGFGAVTNYADMFRELEAEGDGDWKGRFRSSPGYEQMVAAPLSSADLVAVPARPNIDPPPPPTPIVHQLGVLVRRYVAVIRADRGFALTLAVQAPIFGLLFSLMFDENIMTTSEALNASVLVWLIVVGATWLGTSNAIREIVKELPIYRRERAIGLSPGAYLMSKVVVLGAITAAQAIVLVPFAMRAQKLPAIYEPVSPALLDRIGLDPALANLHIPSTGALLPWQLVELILVAIIAGLAAMAVGLVVSSLAGSVDRASTLLPVLLVTQVIVSAPLFTLPKLPLDAVGNVMSAKWGMAAAASTLDLADVRKPYIAVTEATKPDATPPSNIDSLSSPTWRHSTSVWIADVGVLLLLTVVSLSCAWLALRGTDPDLMEARHRGRRQARAPAAFPAAPSPNPNAPA